MPLPPPPKKPLECLTSQGQWLAYLQKHCNLLKQLDALAQTYLPPPLKSQCHVINYRETCLILGCSNASLTTRLRFEIPGLVNALSKEILLKELKNIEVVILPGIPS